MSKIKILRFGFLDLEKDLRSRFNHRVTKEFICKLFTFLCVDFRGAAPITYVHVHEAVLNLPHPYLHCKEVLLYLLMNMLHILVYVSVAYSQPCD